ncbi:MAG: diguanylate cyclase [Peptostreptococcaceae bacterium]|nr:diguanylate cyclase [Peptostreptococcaceae bacterium]
MNEEAKSLIQIEKLKYEIINLNRKILLRNKKMEKQAAELLVANKELAFQNEEKGKRAAEFSIANKELIFQTDEKADIEAELVIADKELILQAKIIEIQKAYYIEKQLLKATLESIGDAVISCDNNANIIFLNRIAELLTGWDKNEVVGKPIEEIFNIANESTKQKSENIIKKVLLSGKITELADYTILINKDGIEMPIEDSAAPIYQENGEMVGAVLVFRDVTDKRRSLRNIEYLSYHDGLTGLYNRRFYEEELKRMDNQRNLPLSLIMGDINGLKLINDSFGHEVGDELLKKTANVISKVCQSNDVYARIGGDEFIIILPNSNADDAAKVIERIQCYLKMEDFQGLEVSVSLGCETKTDIEQDINNIYKNTEDHLNRHKVYESSSMRKKTIDLITNTLYAKNGRELIHSKNVSILAEALAKKMEFSEDDVNMMRLVGLMHDIGKIGIPDTILNKEGKLTMEEYDKIKKHPEIGYRILSSVNEFSAMSECALEHHERWDGTGYPQGLRGKEIKIEARMIAICDAFDAMATLRTYRDVVSQKDTIKEIKRCAGSQFDPDIVEVFIDMIINGEKIQISSN